MIEDNAIEILNKRYFWKDNEGKIVEDWSGLCRRVANYIASDEKENIEKWADSYYDIMYNLRFLPNSPALMNAGKKEAMMSACFVLPINDNLSDIMRAFAYGALVNKAGGGTGYSFSNLRSANSVVGSTSGVASGPISFMKMGNDITEQIKQGGTRRGANMGLLACNHPDIEDFIKCKNDINLINNFNISVSITDEFMTAVKKDKQIDLIDPHSKKVVKSVSAVELFEKIIENAHSTGEPGLFFVDTVNKSNQYGTVYAVNPCGESPLLYYESCNLGSLNLAKYYEKESNNINYEIFEKDIRLSIRLLDSIINKNFYPIPEIKEASLKTRKIGLGVMGFADLLILMGIAYDSKKARKIAENIMEFINNTSKDESKNLGEEKGICEACKEIGIDRRNLWTTIIAPTGTISIIANASSGCEPLFSIAYERLCMNNIKLEVINKYFLKLLENYDIGLDEKLKNKLLNSNSLKDIEEIPKEIKEICKTSFDVSPEDHVYMQSSFQKYVDGGVSKTINMSKDVTKADVRKAYLLAYDLGCKGITVYRDGSRPNQVLSSKKDDSKMRYRTRTTIGTTEKYKTPLGNLYFTVNKNKEEDEDPIEVILNLGKTGSVTQSFLESIGRLISIGLKYKVSAKSLAQALIGIETTENTTFDGHRQITYKSIPDLIGKELFRLIKNKPQDENNGLNSLCPSCGKPLLRQEGCLKCICGFSKC